MPVLAAHKISYLIGDHQILSDVSVSIDAGEVVVVVGRSGAGKSTLIKLLGGLLKPESGKILFHDELLEGPDQKLVAGHEEIQVVHQDFKLMHAMTVGENIHNALLAYTEEFQESKQEELLQLLGLKQLEDTSVHELSGGEKQRVAMARAFANEPEILLMDEPFSNLDLATKATLLQETRQIAKELETGVLLVTHDTRDAFEIADKVLILDDGYILREDTPVAIYNDPKRAEIATMFGLFSALSPKEAQALGLKKKRMGVWAEAIVLSEQNEGVLAEVVQAIFSGPFTKLKLLTKSDITLWAFDFEHHHQTGESCYFTINEKHCFLIKG